VRNAPANILRIVDSGPSPWRRKSPEGQNVRVPANCPFLQILAQEPFGKGKRFSLKGPVNFLLGEWRISGTFSYQNNTPLAFTTSLANPVFGGPIRPNVGNGSDFR